MLPPDAHARLLLHLHSDLEGRVPYGAYSSFFAERIREFFSHKHLDLAPWLNCEPGAFIVSGSPEAIRQLKSALTGDFIK